MQHWRKMHAQQTVTGFARCNQTLLLPSCAHLSVRANAGTIASPVRPKLCTSAAACVEHAKGPHASGTLTAHGRSVQCRASAERDDSGVLPSATWRALADVAFLGLLFASWYLSNIVFNIYNKQVLKVFHYPLTCTTVQFLVGAAVAVFCWTTGLVKKPQVSQAAVFRVLPLAVVHTLGNLLTNVSLGAVAVSFTHTIKAMEPIFSVALSALFLGDYPHPLVLLTLVPIMGGVAMASMSEATFNWQGFLAAMGSNLTFQSRNVLSKKMMLKGSPNSTSSTSTSRSSQQGSSRQQPAGATLDKPLDNINLFAIITCWSAALLLPVNLLVEGWRLTPSALSSMGVLNPQEVINRAIISGLCFHAYQQISYMILARVTPVTHSIGNCVKRVVVIVASVLFFKNPMTTQSALGTAVALLGVFAYSQAKRRTTKPSVKAANKTD